MINIDNRIDKQMLSEFIGKNFNSYQHDEFLYTNTVTGIVGFKIDNKFYKLTNEYEKVDFLGLDSEATVSKFVECDLEEIQSLTESNMIEFIIDELITSITLVNDHYEVFTDNEIKYDWWETRAIIFKLAGRELAFEKQACWFSQEIVINKGYDLIDKLEDGKQIEEDFDESSSTIDVSREIVKLK